MDNKATLEGKKFNEKVARAAYNDLRVLAAEEVLQLVHSGFCKPLKLTVRKGEKKGKKLVTVIGDKVGTLATLQLEGKKWVALEGSKMTPEEFETYTDPALVEEIMSNDTTKTYEEDALAPDGLIPIAEAVEIYSRNTEIHGLVKDYLSRKAAKITSSVSGVAGLISSIGNADQTRMLTALIDALDNRQNEPNVYMESTYTDFLTANPFGADKIVHALYVDYWTISDEEWRLLELPRSKTTFRDRIPLRDIILKKGNRYTEAVRKIAGKAMITGTIYPIITIKAAKIRLDILFRPMFFSD